MKITENRGDCQAGFPRAQNHDGHGRWVSPTDSEDARAVTDGFCCFRFAGGVGIVWSAFWMAPPVKALLDLADEKTGINEFMGRRHHRRSCRIGQQISPTMRILRPAISRKLGSMIDWNHFPCFERTWVPRLPTLPCRWQSACRRNQATRF